MNHNSKQKRKFKRGGVQGVIFYKLPDRSGEGFMTNLSKGGGLIYCYSPTPVQVNDPIEISFSLKNSPGNIRLKAQVVRVTDFNRDSEEFNHQLGIEFLNLTEQQGQAIEAFVDRFLQNIKQPYRFSTSYLYPFPGMTGKSIKEACSFR